MYVELLYVCILEHTHFQRQKGKNERNCVYFLLFVKLCFLLLVFPDQLGMS